MSITTNIITAAFGGSRQCKTRALYQWDYGQVLQFVGLELPTAYTVHFSNQPTGEAKTGIGDEDGVTIPDEYLTTGLPVYAWLYLHTGDSDGETRYTVEIPVKARSRPVDEPPTPQQQSVIDQLLSALESGVERAETAAEHAEEAVESADGSAQAAQTAQAGAETAQAAAAGSATAAAQSAAQAASSAVEASAGLIYEDVSGNLVSFPDGANGARIKAFILGIEPVQAGSGDPSPDNVRPITGRTGASVRVSGKNLWDDSLYALAGWQLVTEGDNAGYYNGLMRRFTDTIFGPNGSYGTGLLGTKRDFGRLTISFDRRASSGAMAVHFLYDDGTDVSVSGNLSPDNKHYKFTSNAAKNCIGVYFSSTVGTSARSQYLKNVQIEISGEETEYEPYAGTTYPVSWETEAGTVCDGSVTLNPDGSADVSACPYYASYAGEALAGPWVSSMDVYSAGATPTTGAQVVDLGGEKTVTHVPAAWTPPMLTHLGANSAWADCGPIEALTYPADTKLYIDKIIAAQAALG